MSNSHGIMCHLGLVLALLVMAGGAAASPLAACPSIPTNDTLDLTAYLGEWYEIASNKEFREVFERGLVCTTAQYSANGDGTIKVNNSGFQDTPQGPWVGKVGKAKQVSGAKLEVSFFGPFYAPYWIINLYGKAATGYSVAVVWSCSSSATASLWILSRTPTLPVGITLDAIYKYVGGFGVDMAKLQMESTNHTGCHN